MEDNVKIFLESGQLELFVQGILDETEQAVVRKFISDNPEIKAEYAKLQDQLESTAISQSQSVPPGLKSEIISRIDEIETAKTIAKQLKMAKGMAVAASFIAIMFSFTTWYNYDKNKQTENQYAVLTESCNENAIIIDKQAVLISFYESSGTQKLEFEGNQLDNGFKSIAYINTEMGKLQYLPGINPKISDKKCLQLWGDLNGEMIPIAVLKNGKSGSFPINPKYTSLNITIENKTADGKGQIHADVSQLLASVTL